MLNVFYKYCFGVNKNTLTYMLQRVVHVDNTDVNSLLFIGRTHYVAAPVNIQFKKKMYKNKMHSVRD